MYKIICHTCDTVRRAEESDVANELVIDHVRRGHRVTRHPVEASEHGERFPPEAPD